MFEVESWTFCSSAESGYSEESCVAPIGEEEFDSLWEALASEGRGLMFVKSGRYLRFYEVNGWIRQISPHSVHIAKQQGKVIGVVVSQERAEEATISDLIFNIPGGAQIGVCREIAGGLFCALARNRGL